MTADTLCLRGLIAATFTPLNQDGSLNLAGIPQLIDHLVESGIAGMYVLGSTGEGPSLTREERVEVAHGFVQAAAGRVPVIIQVGSESLAQARQLAAAAQEAGADAISAVSPVYFKPASAQALIDSMAEIASAAPDLPFFYYHIPAITGVRVDVIEFLRLGGQRIPSLRGVKFTSPDVHHFQACLEFAPERYQLLWGLDEMLLSGLAAGARAAVGSTYNFAAPVYRRLLAAFDKGDWNEARRQQALSQAIVRAFTPYGPRAAQKAIMSLVGLECGPTRLPVAPIPPEQVKALRRDLESIGFFDWIEPIPASEGTA